MKKSFIAALVLTLAWSLPALAAEKNAPPAPVRAGDAGMNRMIRSESEQPMDMNAPMPTGMAKKGMKKGDVKTRTLKKEAVMDDMMKQEEMKK